MASRTLSLSSKTIPGRARMRRRFNSIPTCKKKSSSKIRRRCGGVQEFARSAKIRGHAVRDRRREVAQRPVDDAPEPARGQLAAGRRFIDGYNAADFE